MTLCFTFFVSYTYTFLDIYYILISPFIFYLFCCWLLVAELTAGMLLFLLWLVIDHYLFS